MSNLKSTITCSFYIYVKFHNIFWKIYLLLIAKYHHSLMYTSFLFNEYSNIDTLKSLKAVNLMRAKIDKSSYCI